DRKSTRLNSSHVKISYAVFCVKKEVALERHVLELGVAGVLEHPLLDPERGTVVRAAHDVTVETVVVGDDVQARVHLGARVAHLLDVGLDVLGDVGVVPSGQHPPESTLFPYTTLFR